MQEEIDQRTVSITVQAAKLSGRVLKAAMTAALHKMQQQRHSVKPGRNSLKRLAQGDVGSKPPRWTVYFKANQADALTEAFKAYTNKDLTRRKRPSLVAQLRKFKELVKTLGKDRVRNKEHGGPER